MKFKNNIKRGVLLGLLLAVVQSGAFAQEATKAVSTSGSDSFNMIRYILAGVAILMVLVIYILGKAVKVAGEVKAEQWKKENRKTTITTVVLLLLSFSSLSSFAQNANTVAVAAPQASFPIDIYIYLSVLVLEFVVIFFLTRTMLLLVKLKEAKPAVEAEKTKPVKTFFQKINQTVPVEEESTIDLAHDYDGIRELDNKIPGWWSLAFLATILFGFVYIYRMYVSETLPSQYTELATANKIADERKQEYLKKSANNVDENTVKMLDVAAISEGAGIFQKNCVACHGDKGQGNAVGPNLTDDYWLHKGSLKDIFYSIKYGWQEKGMKAWKDDFSPLQIAQLSSYIKSIKGTNPPGAKEQQGELYTEATAAAVDPAIDSTAAATN